MVINSHPLYQLSYRGRYIDTTRRVGLPQANLRRTGTKGLAAEPGFEPGREAPKAPVLPLHYSATPSIIASPDPLYASKADRVCGCRW